MNVLRGRVLPVVAVGLLVVAGCGSGGGDSGGSGDGGEGTEAVLRALGDEVIVPSYEELVDSLDGLTSALDTLCTTPSEANLLAAHQAWQRAAVAYPATRAGGVGPAMDRRLMSDVAYQVRPQQVTELVRGGDPLDPESLASAGAGARGLSAVELLLFDDGSAELAADAGPAAARRCEYARSASTLSGQAAQEVLDDWTGGYVETLVSGVDGGPQSSVGALVNEVAHALQTLDDKGLRRLVSAGSPDELADAYRDGPAAYHMAELVALHDGIAGVVAGPSGSGDDGLLAVVEDRDPAVAGRLHSALADAGEALDALPYSVAGSFGEPDRLAAASEAVADLKVVVGTEVASVLGVTIGFSDADGDS